MSDLEQLINDQFENRAQLESNSPSKEIKDVVEDILWKLDSGQLRIAEKIDGEWVVHQWLKKLSCCHS